MACAAPLAAVAFAGREERKVVTVLFADLVGFTARAEQLDPEDVRAVLAPYHAHLRSELERFGGTVEKFIGDAVMALFGAPVAHEDDPERAVRAALDIRDWVREQEELQLRIAISTGEALISLGARAAEGEGMAAGDVVNTAARLQSAAPVNGILVGETTYRATSQEIEYREAEPVVAKGKTEPIRVWEALEARARFGVDLGEAKAPLVGRVRELDRLRDALDVARRQRQLQLVTLVGVPGIGKSRLVHELFKAVEAEPDFTTWRQGRSLPYGEGVSFWALAEIVKAQAGILESDSEADVSAKLAAAVAEVAADANEADWMGSRLRGLVGLQAEDESSVHQTERFSAWRTFIEALADDRPLVLVFEDLHWADDGLLDFVDQLVEWARSAPILVLCTARPELLERRPEWGGGKANASTISLPPLEDDETAKLFAVLLQRAVLPAETQAELLGRAAGNPLYAEQYARMLAESDGNAELALPETVQGIIAARLDGLSDREKTLLQDASVVGKVFWLGSVLSIGRGERGAAEEALRALGRKELVQRARRSSVEGEQEYAFEHLLVRDVAYGQIPRAARADKHRAAALWVEELGRPEDHAEMLASHYSRALEYARASGQESGPLVERARQALREAGERAASLQAWPAAVRFYGEALELWPEDDPQLAQIRLACGRAQFSVDGTGLELVNAGVDGLADGGDPEAAAGAAVIAARIHWMVGDVERHDVYLQRALDLVGDVDDSPARVAAMTMVVAKVGFDGGYQAGLEVANEVLPDAERLGLDEERVRLLNLRGDARAALGDDGGFDDLAQSIELASRTHAFEHLHSALNNLMARQIGRGWLEQAQETLDEMKLNLERHPADAERRWINAVEAEISYTSGHWREALSMLDAFIAESEAQSPHYLDSVAHNLRAAIRRGRGERDRAVQDSAKGLEEAHRTGEAQLVGLALVGSAVTLLDEGSSQASSLAAEALDLEPLVLNDWMVVEAAWVMCDLGLAEKYRAWMARGPGSPWIRAAELVCAGEFTRAADALEEIRHRPGEAYARLRAARQLVADGRRAEADAELQRSLAFWRSVGATRYVREGEALLAASA